MRLALGANAKQNHQPAALRKRDALDCRRYRRHRARRLARQLPAQRHAARHNTAADSCYPRPSCVCIHVSCFFSDRDRVRPGTRASKHASRSSQHTQGSGGLGHQHPSDCVPEGTRCRTSHSVTSFADWLGLFIRTLHNLKVLDPGFRTSNLISFAMNPALSGYDPQKTREFYKELQRTLGSTPGVESVAISRVRVLDGDRSDSSVTVEGYRAKDGEDMNPWVNSVSPGYFATLGIPLIAGREFHPGDERPVDSSELH